MACCQYVVIMEHIEKNTEYIGELGNVIYEVIMLEHSEERKVHWRTTEHESRQP